MKRRSIHLPGRMILCLAALVLALCLGGARAEGVRTLRYGMSGEDVLAAQQRLSALGFYEGEADGAFDAETRSAVKRFQEANGLKQTGSLTEAHQAALRDERAVSQAQYDEYRPLSPGSRGAAVEKLQARLQALGYYDGERDGRYSSAVKSAVRTFQTANGLRETGSADTDTRRRMNAEDAIPMSEYDRVCPLKYGNRGPAVRLLQERLTELGYFCAAPGEVYDRATRTAVTEFQAANGLKATGNADYATRARMNGSEAKDASAYYQTIVLKAGASSAAVRVLQARLTELGYFAGTPGCEYDRATKSAVQLFQRANSLRESGNADANTRAALLRADAVTREEYERIRPVKSGEKGEAVECVQRQLAALGYYDGEITGKFDRATGQAVTLFQKANELSCSGYADTPTRKLLDGGKAVTWEQYIVYCPLKYGSRGDAVQLMQRRLIQLGYYAWEENGRYDANTRTAVKAFQVANGLRANGTADTPTRNCMNAATAVTRAAYDANRVIARGEKTTTVRMIKQRLKTLGYYTGEVDINFDSALVKAVECFQLAHSLPRTGKADVETRRQMFSSDAVSYEIYLTYCPISYGAKGTAVSTVQRQLLHLGYYSGAVDGRFGSAMGSAVKLFQKANELTVQRDVSAEMRKLLNAGGGITLAEHYRTCALRKGDKGEPVRVLQRRLAELGYYAGKIDGSYGTELLEAVKLFQKAHSLPETGAADKNTRACANSGDAMTLKQYKDKLAKELEEREAVTREEKIEKLIDVAMNRLDCKYVLNSSGPDTFDCSNFTKYCFGKVGVKISGRVIQQGYMTQYPKITDPKKLKRGDLLIFDTVKTDDDLSDHAGIYLGNDQFIHCSSVRGKVVITKFSTYGDFSWGFRLI